MYDGMNYVRGDYVNQNLAAGIALMAMSMGLLAYVAINVALYGERTYLPKQTVVWLVLQCSVSVFIGVLGGYFLGVSRKSQASHPLTHDSSVQE